jgi:hypothetical protein
MARRAEPVRPPKPAPRPERVEAFRLGLSAESRAALLLIAKAYRILARRWKRHSEKSTSSPAAAASWSSSRSRCGGSGDGTE